MRRSLKWALGVSAATLLGVSVLIVVAPGMPDKAQRQAAFCIQQAKAGVEKDPLECAREANRWLAVPRLFPWTRYRAETVAHNNLRDAARCVLSTSSAIFPDATRRHAAAQVIAGDASEDERKLIEQSGAIHEAALACEVGHMGAGDASCFDAHRARLIPNVQRGHDERALGVARWLADTRKKARMAHLPHGRGCDLQLAAVMCLLGEQKAGQEAFTEGGCGGPLKAAPGIDIAQRFGLEACGGSRPTTGWDVDYKEYAQLMSLVRGTSKLADLRLEVWKTYDYPTRLQFAAAVLLRDHLDASAALELLWTNEKSAARLLNLHEAFSNPLDAPDVPHYEQFVQHDSLYVVPMDLYERAAKQLDELALQAGDTIEGVDGAPPSVRGFFQQVGWIMRLYAASEALRRQDPKRAKKLLLAATPLAGAWSVVRLHLLLQSGAAKEVLAHATAFDKSNDVVERTLVQSYRALALLALGRDEQALAAAKLAHELGAKESFWVLGNRPLPADYARSRIAWLYAAIAWRAGKPLDGVSFADPKPADSHKSGAGLSEWLRALAADGDTRRALRPSLRLLEVNSQLFIRVGRVCDDITPFEMYLAGEAARGDGDIEVWLDRIFYRVMPQGRCALRARANAARWRGDRPAAQIWQQRANRLDKLVANEDSALLAWLARL